jgi:acylphosphatase
MISDELKNDFCTKVMCAMKNRDDGYIDAVVEVAEEHNYSMEMAAKLISKPIIEKIQSEGEDINMLPKMSKLPF